jgi:Big-like domain-containing protein/cellulase (glycosyl hydrolase family 5)
MSHWIRRPVALAAVIAGAVVIAPAAASAKGPAPAVSWQAPVSGSHVATNLKGSRCKVAASDVKKVVFKLDGARLGTDTKAPFTCSIATKKLRAGSHKVTATAYSPAGGESTATSVINVGSQAGPAATSIAAAVPVPAKSSSPTEAAPPVTASQDNSDPSLATAASNLVIGIDGGYFEWSEEEVEMRAQLGAAVTRHEWDINEPVNAQDHLVYVAAAKVHTRIHALLGANELGSASHYKEWVIAFIKRYGKGGSFWAEHPELNEAKYAIQTFELGNEPYYGGMTATQYAQTVRPTLEAVRAQNLPAKLILPSVVYGSDTSWIDTLYQSIPNLNEYFYAFASHPYWYGHSPSAAGNGSPLGRIATLRRRMNELGAGGKPIFITEYGESTADCGEECVSEAEQAAHIATLLTAVLTHPEWGVEMIDFFQLHDWATESSEREEQFGLLRQDGTPKPAYPIVQAAMATYNG